LRAVVRAAVRTVNTPIAKARTTRVLAKAPRPLKIEIGGLHKRPGWVVTNVNAVTRNFLDATERWPLEDGSVSHVYADNVIEHITLEAGRAMLAEAHRCLRTGGVIRLVTPDIRGHVELYLSGAQAIDLVRIPIGSFGHHTGYVYDFDTLESELKRAGFHSVTRFELGESDQPEFKGLDQRGEAGDSQIAVEAVR
jgi:predicted SAM-dependent methyltransferase